MAEFIFPCGMLKNLVAPLWIMAEDANIFFDPDYGIRLKVVCFVGQIDVAVFFRKESLRTFVCPKPTSASIEFMLLTNALSEIQAKTILKLQFDLEEFVLRIRTLHLSPSSSKKAPVELPEEKRFEVPLIEEESTEFRKIDESKFVYDLAVGIPSAVFRKNLEKLKGQSDFCKYTLPQNVFQHNGGWFSIDKKPFTEQFVSIYITDTAIWLKTKEFAILHKEMGDFVTVGKLYGNSVEIRFALLRINAFLAASDLSNVVWICWSKDATTPPMLNFPVGALGNIHIYSRMTTDDKPKA